MVDVSAKPVTDREALAEATVVLSAEVRALVLGRRLDKGDALEVARIAGIMAAKKTSELIPLCHPLALSAIEVELEGCPEGVAISAAVRTTDRTGVEMEALTAVSVAALTLYDMVKSVQRGASITDVRLVRKSGGRSGAWESRKT